MKTTTFITGPHGSGKYGTALKMACGSHVAICQSWNGSFTEIGECCSPNTDTLILHGVYLPEHHENLGLLLRSSIIDCYKQGKRFSIDRPNIIVCTTAKTIHPDLLVNNTTIYQMPIKK
jgi:hypothetical protein